MKKNYILLGVMLFFSSCGADRFIKSGDEATYIGEWYEASTQYAKAYSKIPSKNKEKRGVVAYKLAEANRKCNYVSKAIASYKNAIRNKQTNTLTFRHLADMEMKAQDYKNAAFNYGEYLKEHPNDKHSILGLQGCTSSPLLKKEASAYIVREDKIFNSHYSDYCPMLNGEQIFFSTTRREVNNSDISGITGLRNGDIFYATKDEKGNWKKAETIGAGINTQYDEGAPSFNPTGNIMYFTRCRWDANYPRLAEIYSSNRSDASWSEAKRCNISMDTLVIYAHPAVSPDGKYLYFVSDLPGGYGGLDLWRTEILENGFGLLENLGSEINTDGDEMFPTFRPNGDLYFSSNGRIGMGGLDIFKATIDTTSSHKWKIEHLPYPINSNGDDFGMTFDGIHNRGYFSSNRTNRRGWDKIYTFEYPESIQSVKGWVYEQDGYELPTAIVYMIGDNGTNQKLNVGLNGSFEVEVQPNVNYLFLAVCEGYMNYTQKLQVSSTKESHTDTLQFPLPSVKIPVLVHNVFYEFNKAELTAASTPALNGLVNLLRQNPSITIELSSHCDFRGSQEYNLKLSQRRADAVVKYLITHGIAPERVVSKGYGKLKPKIITGKFAELYPFLKEGDELTEDFIRKLPKNQQDSCNSLNRRTEFTVIKTTHKLLEGKEKLNLGIPEKTQKEQTVNPNKP